jgi:hypothetical protein
VNVFAETRLELLPGFCFSFQHFNAGFEQVAAKKKKKSNIMITERSAGLNWHRLMREIDLSRPWLRVNGSRFGEMSM